MQNLDDFKSRQEWEDHVWDFFVKQIKNSKSEKNLQKFLNCLITKKERKTIINRLLTIALIKENKSYRDIGNILWMSPNTISMIKKAIKKESQYESYYQKNKNNDNWKQDITFNKSDYVLENIKWLFDYFIHFPFPKKIGKGRWKFLDYQGR